MPLGPVTVVDTFSRSVTDGWGTADTGQDWYGTGAAAYDVTGSDATISVSPNTNGTTAYIDMSNHGLPNQTTGEILTFVKVTSSSSSPITDYGPVLMRSASNTFYVASINLNTDKISIDMYANGSRSTLGVKTKSLAKDTWYWIRFRHDGMLRVRMWASGTAEPTSWDLSSNFPTDPNKPTAGDIGFFRKGYASSYTIRLSNFYFYTREDEYPPFPIYDLFERTTTSGWGVNGAEGHVWEGHMSANPTGYLRHEQGSVTDSGDGYATLTLAAADERVAFLGPAYTGNQEAFSHFEVTASGAGQSYRLGIKGNMTQSLGETYGTGYYAQADIGSNTLKIYERNTAGANGVLLHTSAALGFTFTANTQYWMRIQIVGTTINARVWPNGSGEPITWTNTVVDSTITSGGLWIEFAQTGSTSTSYRTYQIGLQTPTPTSTTHTVIGAFSTAGTTDTGTTIRLAYTQDTNNNNSATVQYKKSTSNTWISAGTATDIAGVRFEKAFTGLDPGGTYNFKFTVTDPDTVLGTNPATFNHTLTFNGTTAGLLTVTGVTATTVSLKGTYSADNDNDGTLLLEHRVAGYEQQIVNDDFTAGAGTLLSDHLPQVGTTWIKHAVGSTAGNEGDLYVYNGRVHGNAQLSTSKALWYNSAVPPQSEYDVEMDLVVGGFNGDVGVCARVDTAADTYYVFRYEHLAKCWALVRSVTGTRVYLNQQFVELALGEVYTIRLVVKDAYKACYVDGVEIFRSTDNTITSTGRAGIRFTTISEATPTNHLVGDNFKAIYRSNGGAWTNAGTTWTKDTVNKWFTRTVSGLTSDVIYEFRTTWQDADGVYGANNPQAVTAQTLGQAVQMLSIGASSQPTSSIIDVFYAFDTNNNSALAVQYRSTMNHLWTTVPTTNVSVDRGAKKFSTIIVSLQPSTTYQVKATISDPNGIIEGTPSSLTGVFTTMGYAPEAQKQGKHYLWKVYSPNGEYLTTWDEAGEPEFSWHENGGVSDLAVTLPRQLTDLNDPKNDIAHQNRVDVWCLDPSSDGFGPNLELDPDFTLGAWTLGANAATFDLNPKALGPDGGPALYIREMIDPIESFVTRSNPISITKQPVVGGKEVVYPVPLVIKVIARALGGKGMVYVESYDLNDNKIDQSNDFAETVGSDWQILRFEYTPPKKASYVRVAIENNVKGEFWFDKVSVRAKENLIYRGRVESFTATVDQSGESVEIQILGLVSLLSDDYIDFLQFVQVQPQNDFDAGRPNQGPADPSDMLKMVIDQGRRQNPYFDLYYTSDSIRNTGTIAQYTFRDQQLRACFDKIRALCPSGWHYFVEPDGKVNLRGAEHATTHLLRLGVEIMNFSLEDSIRNLKNYIHVKGRQDEDESEPDGFGSIHYITFDQASIKQYGKRMLFIRDSNITDPETAEIVGEGRLVEYNRAEKRAQCNVPDDKSIFYVGGALRGYNIEEFHPGDNIQILDPVAGPRNVYWDQMVWDVNSWDSDNLFAPLPQAVPIKTVQFHGTYALLELSERQPSSVGDFGRLYRWLQLQDNDTGG
jgi:hypothetical protein